MLDRIRRLLCCLLGHMLDARTTLESLSSRSACTCSGLWCPIARSSVVSRRMVGSVATSGSRCGRAVWAALRRPQTL